MYYSLIYDGFRNNNEWVDNYPEEWEYYNVSEGEFELGRISNELKGLYHPGRYDSHVMTYKIHTACIPF